LHRLFSRVRGGYIQSQNLASSQILRRGEHIGEQAQDTSVVDVYDIAQRQVLVKRFRDDEAEVNVAGIHGDDGAVVIQMFIGTLKYRPTPV
jgi:hypothetical protein